MSTFWHNLMGVDAKGRALTPVYSWADTRSAGAADQLRSQVDESRYHARTGLPPPSQLPAGQTAVAVWFPSRLFPPLHPLDVVRGICLFETVWR